MSNFSETPRTGSRVMALVYYQGLSQALHRHSVPGGEALHATDFHSLSFQQGSFPVIDVTLTNIRRKDIVPT